MFGEMEPKLMELEAELLQAKCRRLDGAATDGGDVVRGLIPSASVMLESRQKNNIVERRLCFAICHLCD